MSTRLRRVLWWVVLAFVSSSEAVPADREPAENRDWRKLVTPNFELYTNGRGSEARNLLRDLETFRYVVSRFLGLTNVQRRPASVFLFRDEATFRPFKPQFEGKPRPVSGFHVSDPVDHVLALSRQGRGTATMRVLFHEYTHVLTARQFQETPLWAVEGVAEVFSTFEAGEGDRFDIGVALTNHVRLLQQAPPLPVAELLSLDRDSPVYNERSRAGRFYATAWLLTHYLVFGRGGYESNAMPRYAALSATSTNRGAVLLQAFGSSPEVLDAELRRYVMGGVYTVVRQTYPDLAATRPQEMALRPGEIDLGLGRLLAMTDDLDSARVRLERAVASAPADPRPFAALALLAWRRNDRPAVGGYVADAIRLNSDHPFVYYLAAELRYQEYGVRRRAGENGAGSGLKEGRRWCERAVELDPWLAEAHHLLGIYTLAEYPQAPARAAVHVQAALRCDPHYQPALLTWASLLAAQGNLGTARQVLTRLLASPLPPQLRDAARQAAENVDRRLGLSRPSANSP